MKSWTYTASFATKDGVYSTGGVIFESTRSAAALRALSQALASRVRLEFHDVRLTLALREEVSQ